ncbi:DUF4760 domain-containing protein [Proteiniclasticum sp. QWL-01]|uniref:DUF4760 domain-containing protein n=1 Tax=Proteiniclasticum sp. QWL-01 TaxID=3036945 RepID=UPI002410A9BD|nr:DUF4760 domain-containing protein [Proteiniclasticum sp. QWL-01]WFF71813.1 DUF4760 domain-containing protein [Proteiniclasticum sp. QWL-01]
MFNFSTLIANICVCVGVIVAVRQFDLTKKSFIADHERRKKQSTIEFYGHLKIVSYELDRILEEFLKDIRITNELMINADSNPKVKEALEAIRDYLDLIEGFSVGINTEVYDLSIFMRIAGRSTTNKYEKLKEYIDLRRTSLGRPNLYEDFEKMVNRIREITNKKKGGQEEDPQRLLYS